LKIQDIEQGRLDELALQERPLHANERFVRKHDRSLGDGIHVARPAQRTQVIEKRRLEKGLTIRPIERGEIGEIVFFEGEILEILDRVIEAAGDRETTTKWIIPKRQVKDGFPLFRARLPIPIRHRELVEVREKSGTAT
jgi:hypothetical protein